MGILHVAICDNDAEQRESLSAMLTELRGDAYEIRTFEHPIGLIGCIWAEHYLPDMILMDVCFPGTNGIEAVQSIRSIDAAAQILYISGHTAYIGDSFETVHAGYLLKPLLPEKLNQALLRAEARIAADADDAIVISAGNSFFRISRRSIRYLESNRRKALIHGENETKEVYRKLDALKEQLGARFIRCHKRYLVNIAHVRRIENGQITLTGGTVIPISKAHLQAVRQGLAAYPGETT